VTGLSIQATDLASKRLELFREIVPGLNRLAIMANASSPNSAIEIGELRSAAPVLGIDFSVFEIRTAADIAPAFEALKENAQALYVPPDPLVFSNRTAINTLALGQRLPTMYAYRDYVQAAGLASYGPNIPDLFRRTADYVDKILRGAKPADVPVEQPTKFDLVINLTTAKALGLNIAESLRPSLRSSASGPTRFSSVAGPCLPPDACNSPPWRRAI
jgi:putative ABC transport system substrate-binding protein